MVNTELLDDLIRLLKKHGANSFEELAAEIKKLNFVENITSILDFVVKCKKEKTIKATKKRTPSTEYPKSLDTLKSTDTEKFNVLNQFYEKILSKQALGSLREINFFREDNDLAISKAKSYKQAIKSLINDLANFSLERLRKLEIAMVSEKKGLEGWSDIILKKSQNNTD